MKIILMLIVGLMLAGCGSTGNHVRNRDAVDRNLFGGFSYGDADASECNRMRKVPQPVTDAVIRVYDGIGNAIETQEHKDDFKEW